MLFFTHTLNIFILKIQNFGFLVIILLQILLFVIISNKDPGFIHKGKWSLLDLCKANDSETICSECIVKRIPRSRHCQSCDKCVEKFDHHCPWVGNCVAKRNYRQFIGFLSSTSGLCCSTLGFSVYHIADVSLKRSDSGINAFTEALQYTGPSIALLIYSFIVKDI